MTPLTEIGECLVCADDDYFLRPSFINMTRIGSPEEIVRTFYELFNDDVTPVVQAAIDAYGHVPEWLAAHINSCGREAVTAAMVVISACCDRDVSRLVGELRPAKTAGKTFKTLCGYLDDADMIVIARSLMQHGIIGMAKVRKLQRHESATGVNEFNAVEYINASRNHFSMSRAEAEQLTMTEFQLLIAAKYPDHKGLTREEYDAVTDDYLKRKARRLKRAA